MKASDYYSCVNVSVVILFMIINKLLISVTQTDDDWKVKTCYKKIFCIKLQICVI